MLCLDLPSQEIRLGFRRFPGDAPELGRPSHPHIGAAKGLFRLVDALQVENLGASDLDVVVQIESEIEAIPLGLVVRDIDQVSEEGSHFRAARRIEECNGPGGLGIIHGDHLQANLWS
jgi:hypothetical protein